MANILRQQTNKHTPNPLALRRSTMLALIKPHPSSSNGSQRVRLSPACAISTMVSLACPISLFDMVPLCIT